MTYRQTYRQADRGAIEAIGVNTSNQSLHPIITASEQRVLQQEGALVPVVEVLGEVLGGHDQCDAVRSCMQQMFGQVHRQHTRTAALHDEREEWLRGYVLL